MKQLKNRTVKMKLKVGDKVRIRKDLKVGERYGADIFVDNMECMRGKVATIKRCMFGGFIIKDSDYTWTAEMFENEVKTDKIIFRDNATILLKDGKRYVTKCQAGDTYDREKGLLLCLAKANGYNYKAICEMLDNAEYQGEKPKKYKITLSEFWANKGKVRMGIHCKSKNEAKKILKAFDEIGEKWFSGDSYTSLDYWGDFDSDFCYLNNNLVGFDDEVQDGDIYEFNEVDLSK